MAAPIEHTRPAVLCARWVGRFAYGHPLPLPNPHAVHVCLPCCLGLGCGAWGGVGVLCAQVLTSFAKEYTGSPDDEDSIKDVLRHIDEESLLPPLLVIQVRGNAV